MADAAIKTLFAGDIYRRIEEVIKVDQTDEQIIAGELKEYVVTDAIGEHFHTLLDSYYQTKAKPHEGTAIWVSGFFGSGKSSFAKMLGLALQNRTIQGKPAADLFAQRTADPKVHVLLKQITEHIPTDAVIFDVSTDRGIRSGNQTLTEITYKLFLRSLGYADDLDLAELEITLEQKGDLARFEETYQRLFDQDWNASKDLISFSLGEASTVMHELYPDRYATPESWAQAVQNRADVNPGKLAERCQELMKRRRPDRNLVFVIDEVGQFVARDVQKMLDLQAVVQSLGRVGRGKIWIVVTSQEKLNELVGGLDDKRVELARLMDRFPLQVHLEPSDISEVTSKRVLSKNADAEKVLRQRYRESEHRLTASTRLTADIQLPKLTAERFMDLYPLLPYQIDLVIQVVSGLRTQGGASKHVGGANRTIIKLAQQLLIHDAVGLAEQPIGKLARIDQVYDLVAGNIASEIRGKIADIKTSCAHPMAQPVAKAICLLQYVQSIHRTAENVAAALHPAIDADSVLPEVKDALQELVDRHLIRLHDGQYRIPTPAEDDWEQTRAKLPIKDPDLNRIRAEVVQGLWEPKPSHNLEDAKTFKGGLVLNGKVLAEEDIAFHLTIAQAGKDHDDAVQEARSRSQLEKKSVFWVAALDDAIDRDTVEVLRSKEMLARKERNAKTKDETALVTEEKHRLRTTEGELRRRMREALLSGVIYFRGNDRSPDDSAAGVSQAASRVLASVLPEVFDRFHEGAARVTAKDLDALMTNENLRGLPPVFTQLSLVKDEKGQPVFVTGTGPLLEVMNRIENKTTYGENATGKSLADELAKEPFGWSFEVVRLFVVALVRAGKLRATSKGTLIESALSIEARNTFPNNNLFRSASFSPRVVDTTIEDWIRADEAHRLVFGKPLAEVTSESAVAEAVRKSVATTEEPVEEALTLLLTHDLPGKDVLREALDHMRAIRSGTESNAIVTFNNGHKALGEAIQRASQLRAALTDPRLHDLRRARAALGTLWSFLRTEPDLPEGLPERAAELADLLARETFYRELAPIDQHTAAIEKEHRRRFDEAVARRAEAFTGAIAKLEATPGWTELNEDQRARVSQPLRARATTDVPEGTTIPFLRAEIDGCLERLRQAIKQMMELLEGSRLVTLNLSEYFGGRVETPEQLEASIDRLRHEVLKLLAADKKVLIQ